MSAKQAEFLVEAKMDAAARVGRATFAAILEARKGDPAFRLTEAALVDALRPALARELPKVARLNGRNVLFDALASGCGMTEPHTKSAAGQVAKALKEIREIEPGVSADDLTATAKAVRRKFEDAGPMAVATHWQAFWQVRRSRQQRAEVTAPVGWLNKLNDLFPDCVQARGGRFEIEKETEYEWLKLSADVRAVITKALA